MLLIAGTVADLDWASAALGPEKFLHWHRCALHSIAGAAIIAAIVAWAFVALSGKRASAASRAKPMRFAPAFLVCLIGALAHVVLDLLNGTGVEALWPFTTKRFALDVVAPVDAWELLVVIFLLGVPSVFRLATQEIGAKAKQGVSKSAIAALAILCIYLAGRYALHARAIAAMQNELFHSEVPLKVGAYPDGGNPFEWDGVVITDGTLQEAVVPVLLAKPFDSDRAVIFPKPPDSAALRAAMGTDTAEEFLAFAKFPRARVIPTEDGYRVEIYDLRFDPKREGYGGISVAIDLDKRAQVLEEKMQWGAPLDR